MCGTAETKDLKANVRRLEEDNEIMRRASILFAGTSTPQPLIIAFIDEMRAEGYAGESVCRVLFELDCQIAARTYREWVGPGEPWPSGPSRTRKCSTGSASWPGPPMRRALGK